MLQTGLVAVGVEADREDMPITAAPTVAAPTVAAAVASPAAEVGRPTRRCARTVFRDHVAAPEDVCWWLRDELADCDAAWVTQVTIAAGGLVAAAARLHGTGELLVHVTEDPLMALIEVTPVDGEHLTGPVAWAVVH